MLDFCRTLGRGPRLEARDLLHDRSVLNCVANCHRSFFLAIKHLGCSGPSALLLSPRTFETVSPMGKSIVEGKNIYGRSRQHHAGFVAENHGLSDTQSRVCRIALL